MLELDLLLVPFCEEEFRNLSEARQCAYVKLLEQEDPDLLAWFSQRENPADPELADLVKLILDRVQP